MATYTGPMPLDSFSPVLAGMTIVRDAVHREFGDGAEAILAKMKCGEPLEGDKPFVQAIISDLIGNESEVEDSLSALGDAGDFPINLMRFDTVYWIQAMEFDDIGYFGDLRSARQHAEVDYEPFITASAEENGT